MSLASIILAAGEGTRMKSKHPKVLHQVAGKTMVEHVMDAAAKVGSDRTVLVVGSGKEAVEAALSGRDVQFAHQIERLGTGHAVRIALDALCQETHVLILCGDTPLLTSETLASLVERHESSEALCTVLTADLEDPFGYGRILRDSEDQVLGIVEEKDASPAEKQIREINSGVYVVRREVLLNEVPRISNDNVQKEYYLTDLLKLIRESGGKVCAYKTQDAQEISGVNSRVQLSVCEQVFRQRLCETLMLGGVTMIDPQSVYVDTDVVIGRDTVIYPGCVLEKGTVIGEDCVIGPNARLKGCVVGNGVSIKDSTVVESRIGNDSHVGPYAYLRPGSVLGQRVKVGDFVEIKNSNIGDDAKISHLTYVGDGDVGENVNLGCGVVFVNYDGKKKHRTVVEKDAFVGCNVNLVSPVTVGEGAYVAAGSTITKDVPQGSLAIAREKQKNIEGWVMRKR
jgi:bifunctional UDP-N-acetylglucosamine pyrophosphorylase/glucosamine-1-phosphate N-acetyltransferase